MRALGRWLALGTRSVSGRSAHRCSTTSWSFIFFRLLFYDIVYVRPIKRGETERRFGSVNNSVRWQVGVNRWVVILSFPIVFFYSSSSPSLEPYKAKQKKKLEVKKPKQLIKIDLSALSCYCPCAAAARAARVPSFFFFFISTDPKRESILFFFSSNRWLCMCVYIRWCRRLGPFIFFSCCIF